MNKEYVFVGTAQLKTRDYINQLQQENQKYKEVIDKAIEILKLCNSQCAKETIDILKEVE